MITTQHKTVQDLLATPDDGYRYELVRGEILRMPPPKGEHGAIEAALVEAIGRYLYMQALSSGWAEGRGLRDRNHLVGRVISGEAGIHVRLPDDTEHVRGIDVGYLTPEQVARIGVVSADAYFPEAPALVAEVVSPSEGASYLEGKVADYLAGGARLVWLLFPELRTARVHQSRGASFHVAAGDALEGGEVLPGFRVALANLFS
jgi:Uma2 family endonuclease